MGFLRATNAAMSRAVFLKVHPWLATHHASVWVKFAVVFCTCICSSCMCTFAVVFSIDSLVDNAPCNSVVSAHSFCRTCLCSSCTCSFFSKCFPAWHGTMDQRCFLENL